MVPRVAASTAVHVLLNRALRHMDSQLQQLASDAFNTAPQIPARHALKQRNGFRR
jgi:hypothetical protein